MKLFGIRIMSVKLTGDNEYVIVQLATIIDPIGIPGGTIVADGSNFTPLKLVRY